MAGDSFNEAAEGQQNWAIRAGAEPFDFHGFIAKGSDWDRAMEDHFGWTSGVGGWANHNYLEIGTIGDDGNFVVAKRVHGMGLNEDWEMAGLTQRFVAFVTDGKYTPFVPLAGSNFGSPYNGGKFKGDLIQRDDPHDTLPNQLQHADEEGRTEIIFQGTEREVLQLYGAMIRDTIEINNRDLPFGLDGLSGEKPNSNMLNAELKESLVEMAQALGISDRLGTHDSPGWDLGADPDRIQTGVAAPVATWESVADLRHYIDALEQTAASQLKTLRNDGIQQDLETSIPAPGTSSP